MKRIIELFVHEEDVTEIYKHLQNTLPASRWSSISIGWCGWANAMDCWWVRVPMKKKERDRLLDWIDQKEFKLYDPDNIH